MPYAAHEARGFTRKANTGSRSRQWKAVYDSSIARGDDEGTAITKASGVAKKNWQKTNPARRKPSDRRPAEMKTASTVRIIRGTKSYPLPPGLRPRRRTGAEAAAALDKALAGTKPKHVDPAQAERLDRALRGVSFAKQASTSVADVAKVLEHPEKAPGRVGRWAGMLERLKERRGGQEKTALRMTASVRLKRLRSGKKFPTVKATDIKDLGKRMTGEARRMSTEAGKGPVVSRKKLWKQHSRRGGRVDDVTKSFEASRTFASPAPSGQDKPGIKTVQFKDKPKPAGGASKSRVAAKAKRKPTGKK